MKDILVIEDDKELGTILCDFLARDGYSLCHKTTGEEGVQALHEEEYKMVLLDLMLPGIDGFAICEEVRQTSNIPILILSAKVDKDDKISTLNLGADDYIEKPYDMDILLAKIKAQLRRSYGLKEKSELLADGDITVNLTSNTVYKKGEPLIMTNKEYELLVLFLQNKGKTLRKEWLFNQIWGVDCFSEFSTLTVHINKLRDKIEKHPKEPKKIQTVWGIGYKYEAD